MIQTRKKYEERSNSGWEKVNLNGYKTNQEMIITKKTEGRGDVVNKIENAWSEWQFNCMR